MTQIKQDEWHKQWEIFRDDELFLFKEWIYPNTIYLLPVTFLPYYEYFKNFRKLSFCRNCLNVFDKLNAPQVTFIDKKKISDWFNAKDFKNTQISSYKGVSWWATGIKNEAGDHGNEHLKFL